METTADQSRPDVPLDYRPGYERARRADPELAETYIALTRAGDPIADEMTEVLAEMPSGRRQALYRGCMDNDPEALKAAPEAVRRFFEEVSEPPEWFHPDRTRAGIRAFHANADLVLQAFAAGVLIEGFGTNVSKSFVITGALREQGVARLKQNNRHVLDIFLPGGLDRLGDGWKLSVRARLVHAQVRRLLERSPQWDTEAWGTPISGAHMGYSSAAFSARLLKHSMRLGAHFTDEERHSFMQVWRYSTHLMGTPAQVLMPTEKEALHLYDIARMCEPEPDLESIITANALVKGVPQVVGITDQEDARALVKKVYTISRALIGDDMADRLNYPKYRTTGVLRMKRLGALLERTVAKALPGRAGAKRFDNFSGIMSVAAYQEEGITYSVPEKVRETQAK